MKKLIYTTALCLCSCMAMAQFQTTYDALAASASELNGTARFVAVGGAMGALGGDATCVAYNPAGIGVYRSSELTITGNIHWTNSSMNAQYANTYIDANLANVAYIGTWLNPKEKGLISLNFGITYNRTKNFSREVRYNGTASNSLTQFYAQDADGIRPEFFLLPYDEQLNASDVSYRSVLGYKGGMFSPIDGTNSYASSFETSGAQSVNTNIHFTEFGYNDEYALSIGGNVANVLYWGMSFNCDYLWYKKRVSYRENVPGSYDYDLSHSYQLEGSGCTYQVGAIVRPTNWLRIGAAFHTPTWFFLKDYSYSDMYSNGHLVADIPSSSYLYDLQTPLKALGSLGFVLGKFGFIGIDYEYSNYHLGMVLTGALPEMQAATNYNLSDVHKVRVGMEFKPIESLALRLGGGYSFPYTNADASRYMYGNDVRCDTDFYNEKSSYNATAGIGYRIGRHAIDLAYVWQVNEADYYSFPGSDPIALRSVRNQIVFSYGIRF